jgi:hypothetical protein
MKKQDEKKGRSVGAGTKETDEKREEGVKDSVVVVVVVVVVDDDKARHSFPE